MMLFGISIAFAMLSPIRREITHALLTRAPLYYLLQAEEFSCDLHVLSTPPAFILSQDQTLQLSRFCLSQSERQGIDRACFTRHHYLVFKDQAVHRLKRPWRRSAICIRRKPYYMIFI